MTTVNTLYDSFVASFRKSAQAVEPDVELNPLPGEVTPAATPQPASAPTVRGPRPAPALPPPPADPTAVAVGGDIVQKPSEADIQESVRNVTADAQGAVRNAAEGKSSLFAPLQDTGNLETLIARGQFASTPLYKELPTVGIDKMTPQQLGMAMRAYRSVAATPTLAQVMAGKRLFTNPMNPEDPKANLDLDAVRGLYERQVEKLAPEKLPEYRSALYPGAKGEAEESVTQHGVPLVAEGAPSIIKGEVTKANAELKDALVKVEKDPDGTGFTDWFTESWGNIAVPAGMLLMLFGGDTGALLGGLAVAAGGYDLYNRYNTLTNDPAAQIAITQFVKGGMNKKALEDIRANFGDRYAKASLDFMALSRYGFLSVVQNKYRDAGMRAYRAQLPGASDKDVEAFGKTLPSATPDQNTTVQDWGGKGMQGVSNLWKQGAEWVKNRTAAT